MQDWAVTSFTAQDNFIKAEIILTLEMRKHRLGNK